LFPRWLVPSVIALLGPLSASAAFAQDPAEDPPADPAPEEAPAADAPAADPAADPAAADPNAAPGDDASLEVGDMEVGDVDATAPGDGSLDEVVVTVDRRAKNLQKYSGTASSFSQSQLSAIGITNVRDLSSQVPGLQIGNQEGNTEVYIRGIGSDNNTELGDPAVALHLDGVYLPRPRALGAMFFDIARVEVNSGPQGTLRGRNALGGAVNIVSNAPKFGEFEANAEATFGTFAQRSYNGMVNIPIGDRLAFRFAGFSEVHDPWWENAGPIYDIKGPESIDSYAFRAQGKWQPVQAVTALVGFDYTRERGTGWLGANFQGALTQEDEGPNPDIDDDNIPNPIAPDDIENPRRIYNRGMQSWLDTKHYGVRTQINVDAGAVQIEALASYRNMRFVQNNGGSAGLVYPGFTPDEQTPDNFGSSFWDQGSESYIGELRLFAPDTDRLRWTIGGFGFRETQDDFLGQTSDQGQGFGGGEFPMPSTKSYSIAGYADATFDVTEAFRVIGGIRVTHEEKERKGGLWALWTGWPAPGTNVRFGTEGFQYYGVDSNILELPANSTVTDRVNLFLDGIKSFGARDTIPQYLCADPPEGGERLRLEDGHFRCANGINPSLLADEAAGNTPFGIQAVPQNNEVSATYVDWRAGIELDIAKDSMVYATASTGHKSGGFNDTAAQDGLFNSEYGPESVIAFELGSKNTLLDRHLRLNASAFFYHYNDMVFQTIVSVTPPDEDGMGGSNTAVRQNAASANIYGLDMDATFSLPAGLEAELHALLMDARFGDGTTVNDSRIGFDVSQYPVDISGNWLPRVSPLTLNYNLSQLIFTSVGSFNWVISGQTRTKHFFTVFNGEGELLDATDGRIPTDADGNVLDSYSDLQRNPARLTDVVNGYTRFDAGIGWKHPDGRISINGFVNNVFNTTYPTSIIATPGLNLRFFNPPRIVGVRFRVDW
jgi:iron complex outermembrane receptor protein